MPKPLPSFAWVARKGRQKALPDCLRSGQYPRKPERMLYPVVHSLASLAEHRQCLSKHALATRYFYHCYVGDASDAQYCPTTHVKVTNREIEGTWKHVPKSGQTFDRERYAKAQRKLQALASK